MECSITYYSETVQDDIFALPDTLAARYVVLTRRMVVLGPHLGEPHTKAFGEGLFELRLKGAEGIARVFFLYVGGPSDRHASQLHQENKQDAAARVSDCNVTAEGDETCKRMIK